jgi:gliding motility-associated-like protein
LRANAPQWTEFPSDTVVAYRDAVDYSGYPLSYSNLEGACVLAGSEAPASIQRNFSICGGSMTIEWVAVSFCGDSLRASQQISVQAAPAPQVDLSGHNTTICEYDYLQIQPTLSNVYPELDYRWEYSADGVNFAPIPGQTAPDLVWGPLSVSDEGFVRLVLGIEEEEGCSFVSSPLPFQIVPRSVVNSRETICFGERVLFAGEERSVSGIYIDTLGNANGCDSIVVLSLEVLPAAENYQVENICAGDTIKFAGKNLYQGGSYQEIFTGANGCDSVVNLELNVYPESETNLDFEICVGDTLRLLDRMITGPMEFSEIYSNMRGCDSVVTYKISAVAIPQVNFTDYYICPGETVQLQSENAVSAQIRWEPSPSLSCTGCDDPVASPQQTTDYIFSVPSCNNEVLRDTLTVFVVDPPQLLPIEPINLTEGEIVEISLESLTGELLYEVQWRNEAGELLCGDCPGFKVDAESPDVIVASAANESGCRSQTAFEVVKSFGPCQADQIEVANAMTLNNDGINELMEIRNPGRARIASIQVFTRWGELIFASADPEVRWNGTIAGEPVNQGVYVYVIKGTCANGRDPFILNGNITVLR